eukprot:136667-Prorocentrum_minimum.AAC.1
MERSLGAWMKLSRRVPRPRGTAAEAGRGAGRAEAGSSGNVFFDHIGRSGKIAVAPKHAAHAPSVPCAQEDARDESVRERGWERCTMYTRSRHAGAGSEGGSRVLLSAQLWRAKVERG